MNKNVNTYQIYEKKQNNKKYGYIIPKNNNPDFLVKLRNIQPAISGNVFVKKMENVTQDYPIYVPI